MRSRENPIGIEATGQIDVDLAPQLETLHRRIVAADNDRARWLKKQEVLLKQRRGDRAAKNIPWVGSNNDHIPLTESTIRRWKPNMTALVLASDPVSWFKATKAEDLETAKTAQEYYHWKFTRLPDLVRRMHQLVDMLGQYGIVYSRQGWDYRTEQRCRIIRADALFPGGVEAAWQGAVQQIRAANLQAAQAAMQQGAQPGGPEQQMPEPTPEEFVEQTLRANYDIDESDVWLDEPQLKAAVQALLDGAKFVKIYTEIVVADQPALCPVSPLDVIVPICNKPLDEQDFVAIVHRFNPDELRARVRDGVFRQDAVEEIIAKSNKGGYSYDGEIEEMAGPSLAFRSGIVQSHEHMDGVQSFLSAKDEPPQIIVWEIHTKLNLQGTMRRVILWYQPKTKITLSTIDNPYPFNEIPLTAYEYEVTAERPYQARGIAEMLSTYQKLVSELHNARLDAIQVILSPMFTWRNPSQEFRRNLRFRPGIIIPVQGADDLKPVVQDYRPLSAFIQEEQMTKALAEQLIGVFDQSLMNIQNPVERRTATEVQAATNMVNTTFQQDAELFQAAWARTHRQLWSLILEFGPEDDYYRVTGEDTPRRIVKKDIAREYDIFPAGTPANTNKSLALSRAREMLQIFVQDQTGLINKRELYKAYLDVTDPLLAKRVLRTEEEAAAIQTIVQMASEATGGEVAAP